MGDGKSRTITIDKQADIGRRLVEYFVVVSSLERKPDDEAKKKKQHESQDPNLAWKTESISQEDIDEFSEYCFRPTITARYPMHDHSDNPLHDNVTFFCHPTGTIHLRTEDYMPKVRQTTKQISLQNRLSSSIFIFFGRFIILLPPVELVVRCMALA
jgi:uDENN domain